ncbi:MAG: phosphatidylserine decarboxylase [Rubrobacter sp.]|nr:phosphatidylserine decarboxylase [Rubrobacter sp.]
MTRRSWETARPYVLAPLVLGLLLLALGRRRAGWLGLGVAGACLGFFRDPERHLDPEPDVVYAAADGFVKTVEEVEDASNIRGGAATRISTFLSLHNVHVNRSPVAGRVSRMKETGGGYAPALFSSAEENYGKELEIDGERGSVLVVQKAGLIARRISSWTEVGESLKPGQRIGLIHFGSRTDVLFPAGSAEVLVRPGQRVWAGLTPLARYRGEYP